MNPSEPEWNRVKPSETETKIEGEEPSRAQRNETRQNEMENEIGIESLCDQRNGIGYERVVIR